MKAEDIKVVIGTNSWGSSTYGTLVRGSSVDERTIKDAVNCANEKGTI